MNTLFLVVNARRPKAREVLELIAKHCELGSASDFQKAIFALKEYDVVVIGPEDSLMETMTVDALATMREERTPAEQAEAICAVRNQTLKELGEMLPLMKSASESARKLRLPENDK